MTNISRVLIKPVMTEKTSRQEVNNQYTFLVDLKASKVNIKQAIKKFYNVDAVSINTLILKGKQKRQGKFIGKRNDRKKAIITLAEGQVLPIWGAEA
ncbi:MAG: 50S ribosomal protein L23 [Gammaproteobacteria bacterium]|nr:50S ribosomal protein L23 [Gammaproteobacteria bacterium]